MMVPRIAIIDKASLKMRGLSEVMMSNRLFQSIIHKMGESVSRTIGVVDSTGTVVACSDLSRVGNVMNKVGEEISFMLDTTVIDNCTYRPIGSRTKVEYAAFADGSDELAYNSVSILSVSLENLKTYYDDKYDKATFIKGVILDNVLPSDVYLRAREFRFSETQPMVAILVRFTKRTDLVPLDIISNIFSDKNRDYVIGINETDVAIVKTLGSFEIDEAESVAKQISDTIAAEFYLNVVIGVGTIVSGVKDLGKSYKESQIALEVGRVFENDRNISSYETLGIGRLIYHLPTTLCNMFLDEVMKNGSLESLDRETLLTIQCFFENSLNVSETSRKLFIHRNTLVYRLEKIKKMTGLDVREFENAITFKVALMVRKYLSSKAIGEDL